MISVVTNLVQYEALIENNPFLRGCTLIKYENTRANIPIPVHFNHFLENKMPKDAWLVLCHQDFEFLESPQALFAQLDKNVIYGPIGVQTTTRKTWSIKFGGKSFIKTHRGKDIYPLFYGQIKQGVPEKEKLIGRKITRPHLVDTVDACCQIVHSSLIRKYNLRFDPAFDFHLYCEDFSLAARQYGISTYAVQINCRHISPGHANRLFWDKYTILLKKYPKEFFVTTCAGVKQYIHQSLALRWPLFSQK